MVSKTKKPVPSKVRRNRYKQIAILGVVLAVAIPLALVFGRYDQNTDSAEPKNAIIAADRYLAGAKVVDKQSIYYGKHSYDFDLHLRLSVSQAQELVAQNTILYDCDPIKAGCPDKAWQPYRYYITSYNKTYTRPTSQGSAEVRHANPALPNLEHDPAIQDISCTMFQARSDMAYGLCVNPRSGDFWYHSYKFR